MSLNAGIHFNACMPKTAATTFILLKGVRSLMCNRCCQKHLLEHLFYFILFYMCGRYNMSPIFQNASIEVIALNFGVRGWHHPCNQSPTQNSATIGSGVSEFWHRLLLFGMSLAGYPYNSVSTTVQHCGTYITSYHAGITYTMKHAELVAAKRNIILPEKARQCVFTGVGLCVCPCVCLWP